MVTMMFSQDLKAICSMIALQEASLVGSMTEGFIRTIFNTVSSAMDSLFTVSQNKKTPVFLVEEMSQVSGTGRNLKTKNFSHSLTGLPEQNKDPS